MKTYMKSLVALLLCCLLVSLPGVPVQASEMETDLMEDSSNSSLTVILQDPVTNKSISGIELTIYKVGTLSKDSQSTDETDESDEPDEFDESVEEGYYVVVCDDPDHPVPLDDIYYELTNQRAAELEAYVKANSDIEDILIATLTTDGNGTAVFDNLTPGLYLVIQTGDSKEYIMSAFLVMLPAQYGEGADSVYYYDYNVIAKPKVIETKTIEDPNDPNDPNDPDDSNNPKKPKESKDPEDPNELWNLEDLNSSNDSESSAVWQRTVNLQDSSKLPQTGQLWWPVTVMSVVGLLCCGTGYWLKRSSDCAEHRK